MDKLIGSTIRRFYRQMMPDTLRCPGMTRKMDAVLIYGRDKGLSGFGGGVIHWQTHALTLLRQLGSSLRKIQDMVTAI